MLLLRPYQKKIIDKIKIRLKEVSYPLLATVSVGGGKSLLISTLLSWASSHGYRCLCLTLNSTLIKQNSETHKSQQGDYGINCSSLNSKSSEDLVIFGSPNSICQDIRSKKEISTKPFQLIIVDECHQISPHNENSMYKRIFNHFGLMAQQEQYSFRIIGFTGTPFRDKSESIVGENAFFKEEVCNITTKYLIDEGFLTPPHFGLVNSKSFDFKNIKIENTGKFNQKQLQEVIDENIRLTGEIMLELQQIECNGIFIFCSSISHCYEALKYFPSEESAVIVGSTPHHERQKILNKARIGEIKYLISVSILMVGVDIPFYDYCAWLRPTESLILFTQGIGRVLRLHPYKKRCVILDYAGNLERHGDIDDPIINDALQPKDENEKDYVIPCYTCNTQNTIHARRCIGIVENKRCDHFFEFKECPSCQTENDKCSRLCRNCKHELIDPNAKLHKIIKETHSLDVIEAHYKVYSMGPTLLPIINISYDCGANRVAEYYYTNTPKNKNILYAKFIKLHFENPSQIYPYLSNLFKMREIIETYDIKTPSQLICVKDSDGYFKLMKKIFM